MEILYIDKNIVAINKPTGMPSQSDMTGAKSAMEALGEELLARGERSDLWLVHRLDRGVGGVLAFARNKAAAAELSRLFSIGECTKKYILVASGAPERGEYRDYLFKDSSTSKSYVVKTERRGAKLAVLDFLPIAEHTDGKERMTLGAVSLKTGRFHQIRAQLSSRGTPLIGDRKYGAPPSKRKTPALFASELSFLLFGKKYTVLATVPDEYPFNLFDKAYMEM